MVAPVEQAAAEKAGGMQTKLEVRDLSIRYDGIPALEGVSLDVRENEIFGIIGPANAGKTSFLKAINRMDMFNPEMKVEGDIRFNGIDTRKARNVYGLRRRIGVVFPLPVGLPLSIYDNVALAPRLAGQKDRGQGSAEFTGQHVVRRTTTASDHRPRPFPGAGTADAR
jgi:phosphate transport system ATP-binding protein